VNVIRIIGSGVGQITIRDLCVDANREQNCEGAGDPNISHDRFEFCGIKAFRQAPRGPGAAEDTHDITIRNCIVKDAHRLGIMLEGPNMRVLDNFLGNAGSDSVEILTGPGIIRGNIVEITDQTHVAIGSDRANSIIMADNIVRVKRGGRLDIGFRSWAGSKRHVIANNVLTVEDGGSCSLAMDIRGTETTITANNIHTFDPAKPTRLRITAGNAVVSANVLEHALIEVEDQTGANQPIMIEANVLQNAQIVLRRETSSSRLQPGNGSETHDAWKRRWQRLVASIRVLQFDRQDLILLDELGYVPFSKAGAELLFDVVGRAYERTSLIVTTNLPFEQWTEVLGSERLTGALLDRLTHRVHILEANGLSYRLQDAKRRLKRK